MSVLDLIALTGIPMSHPMLNGWYAGILPDGWSRASGAGAYHANPMHTRPDYGPIRGAA